MLDPGNGTGLKKRWWETYANQGPSIGDGGFGLDLLDDSGFGILLGLAGVGAGTEEGHCVEVREERN